MPHADDAALAPELLMLRHCGRCGYRLAGLPAEGRCPECGNPYAADEIVIFGWPPGGKLLRGRTWLIPLVLLVMMVSTLVGMATDGSSPRWLVVVCAAIWVPGVAAALWQLLDRQSQAAGPMRVYVARRGFAISWELGPVRPRPWGDLGEVRLRRARNGCCRIRFGPRARRWWHPVWYAGIEFECDQASEALLRTRIDAWRAAVRGDPR